MRPIARHAAAALILCGIAWAGWPAAPKSPAPSCHDWIEVRRAHTTLQCGIASIAATLDACDTQVEIRRGDRVRIDDCTIGVGPMNPRRRLALGMRLDVNTASNATLTAVSGIGPAMARRIVAKRPYTRIEDLERVRGIGPKRRRRFMKSLRIGPERRLWPRP